MKHDFRFGRETALALAGGLALAALMFMPLPAHLTSQVLVDAGDPQLATWQIAWSAHALLNDPLSLWQANVLYPNEDVLAFSDASIGWAPLAMLGGGLGGAVAAFNVAVLLAYAFTFAGAYLLARELGLGRGPAIVAGLLWAWAPWRWAQTGHLHVLSCGPLALALALLLRGYRRERPWAIVGGWVVAAWQVLLSVSIGLYLIYLLAALALVTGILWHRAGRPRPSAAVVRATVGGLAVLAAVLAIVAVPYLRVGADYPEAEAQRKQDIEVLSPQPKGFLATKEDNLVWGDATASLREDLRYPTEMILFPGALMLALAAVGLRSGAFSRRLRFGLAAVAAVCFVFSLGYELLDGRLTYRLLVDYAPGWEGPRTPGRLHILTTLALALLAGAGAARLTELVRERGVRLGRRAPAALCAVLAVGILAEGAHFRIGDAPSGAGKIAGAAHARVDRPPAGLDQAREPLLILPVDIEHSYDYMVWTTDTGFPRIVNGLSGFLPAKTTELVASVAGIPDPASLDTLRRAGVRTVVVRPELLDPTALQRIETAPAEGFTRRRVGDVLLLEL